MPSTSNDNGRAYEFIWLHTLCDYINQFRPAEIEKNSSYYANGNAWNSMSENMQEILRISSLAAVETLIELEPLMDEPTTDLLLLRCQADEAGVNGDVRDIIIERNQLRWQIGLSIKHNHDAVKHSRLSKRLDFGQSWFGIPCSDEYWEDVTPIFDYLTEASRNNLNWSDIENKDINIYVPLLEAFMAEIERSYESDPDLPQKMVEYLIGKCDYHKIVSHDSRNLTTISTFNIHNTLNQPSQYRISSIQVPTTLLPTELVRMKFKQNSTNTVEMYLNNGWQLSFRIHNASTKCEPSLKFDVQFMGMPTSVLCFECHWSRI